MFAHRSLPRRRVACVFLQPACELSCPFCATEPGFDRMSAAEAAALVDRIADAGCESIVFGGGEPLEWPHDLFALCARARNRGLLVQVGTAGARLPARFAVRPEVDRWILPLESADAAVHARLRPSPVGHHAHVLALLDELAHVGRATTVSTVISSENRRDVRALGALLAGRVSAGLPLHAWHLYRFLPIGRGGAQTADRLEIRAEDYRIACEEAQAGAAGVRVYRRPDMTRSREVEFLWMEAGRLQLGSDTWGRSDHEGSTTSSMT